MTLTLHAVVIKKPISLLEAKKLSKEFIKNEKVNFYRETAESFRFRNKAKTKFDPNTFISKVINDKITLVLGKLL